jgi:hypothetical protein
MGDIRLCVVFYLKTTLTMPVSLAFYSFQLKMGTDIPFDGSLEYFGL